MKELVLLLAASTAFAQPPTSPQMTKPPVVTGVYTTKVAVLPLRDSNGGSGDATQLERAVVEALRDLPGLVVGNLRDGKLFGPKSAPLDARADPHGIARVPALAKETNAVRVLAVEASRLGDGRVLYLQSLDPQGGQIASTTVPLKGESGEVSADDRTKLRTEIARVLEPKRFIGRLNVKVDVNGAEVFVDGAVKRATDPIELAVGTHTVRVTHPAYRDYMRFVDIEFDKNVSLEAGLAAYPLAEGEMRARQRFKRPDKNPFYKRWWFGTAIVVGAAALTVGIVWGARPSLHSDQTVTYTGPPAP
jgi:hypothetical protein